MLKQMGKLAKKASLALMNIDAATKSAGLTAIASALVQHTDAILAENQKDVMPFWQKAVPPPWLTVCA